MKTEDPPPLKGRLKSLLLQLDHERLNCATCRLKREKKSTRTFPYHLLIANVKTNKPGPAQVGLPGVKYSFTEVENRKIFEIFF